MSSFDFEEYRLPWETGPHWELKKEFLEKYKDSFPKDRLLCLAQAYSNMELLDCTYPTPVMLEVSELAKSLHVCKRLREASQKKDTEDSSQKKKRGKRSLSCESTDKRYFVKFCAATPEVESDISPNVQDTSSIKMDSSSTTHLKENPGFTSSNIEKTETTNAQREGKRMSKFVKFCAATPDVGSEVLPNVKDSSGIETDSSSTTYHQENPDFTSSNIEKTETTDVQRDYFILNITRSPFISEIKALANHLKGSSGIPIGRLENAVYKLGFEKARFNFSYHSKTPGFLSHFYVRDTLISIGRDHNEQSARGRAAEYALEVLSHLQNLPCKTLNDLKCYWIKENDSFLSLHKVCCSKNIEGVSNENKELDSNTLRFWLNFALKVQKFQWKNSPKGKSPSATILDKVAKEFKTSIFTCAFTEDFNSPINNRVFSCDLFLENTIISQGMDKSKKKAKTKALDSGLTCIMDLIKWHNENIHKSNRNHISDLPLSKDDLIINVTLKSSEAKEVSTQGKTADNFSSVTDELKNELNSSKCLSLNQNTGAPTSNQNISGLQSGCENRKKSNPGPLRLNHRLLQNSIQKELVICDTSEINPGETPQSILQCSASLCHKDLNYEREEIILPSNECLHRIKILFGRDVVGTGEGSTKTEAKRNGAENTIASLKKNVYTIKVKNELSDGGFEIKRSQVTDMKFSSNTIPDNNVGCKLLKMMGWSGGAIGVKGGLTEPIVASDHPFHQGLGFSKKAESDEKHFKQKINNLLYDFSQSNSTGDLIFSSDFSKDERKSIHKLANRYNLVSSSRGKNDNRRLFIRRKLCIKELLHLVVQAGGSTSKYELLDCSQ